MSHAGFPVHVNSFFLKNMLQVREIESEDVNSLVSYWMGADPAFLQGMGVDIAKRIDPAAFEKRLRGQIEQPYPEKKSYCLIWVIDGVASGHSNANPIQYGVKAHMHLHIWNAAFRKSGYGVKLLLQTLPFYFENLQLEELYCEPYALNAAPNRTLEKCGFTFVKEYTTIPGAINFEQPVKQWRLTREAYLDQKKTWTSVPEDSQFHCTSETEKLKTKK